MTKKSIDSTWGFRDGDIDEYMNDSLHLSDKLHNLQTVCVDV